MIKIITAFDSFKGSLSALQACEAAAKAVREIIPESTVLSFPVTDGGDGMIESYKLTGKYDSVMLNVKGPYNQTVKAEYLIQKPDTAIIEMAQAAGILTTEERHGADATTFGVGELVKDAIKRGCRKLIIGLGGSATNDAGAGFLAALGAKFYINGDKTIIPTGRSLSLVKKIDLTEAVSALKGCKVFLRCDVKNKLYGKDGATYVFGPQKGVKDHELKAVDNNLLRYAKMLENLTSKSLTDFEGSGAAGGFAVSCSAIADTTINSGIEEYLKESGFYKVIRDSN
ncbi:MAG: glycerate kinase, partial [Oscillospiraceae bacterium]|nr:glycerate kinase [Oscillospiraceae bacterium]